MNISMEQRVKKLEDRLAFMSMIMGKLLDDKRHEISGYDLHRMQELAKKGAHIVERRDKEDEARRRYLELQSEMQILAEDFPEAIDVDLNPFYRRY